MLHSKAEGLRKRKRIDYQTVSVWMYFTKASRTSDLVFSSTIASTALETMEVYNVSKDRFILDFTGIVPLGEHVALIAPLGGPIPLQ
jgi:hypothetical protein